jgi:hypothetical protein
MSFAVTVAAAVATMPVSPDATGTSCNGPQVVAVKLPL